MRTGPVILLALLGLSLTFILGIQYGKRVEVTDQAIEVLLQRIPTPTPAAPTEKSRVVYKSLKSNRCGFSFVYPSSYEIQITSTYSAELLDSGRPAISFSCSPEIKRDRQEDPNNSSIAASLDDAPALEYVSNGDNSVTFITDHPSRPISLELTLTQDVKLLIERTFQFNE